MYAEILINHAYSRKQGSFTYAVPEELEIQTGSGVVVPFQSGKQAGVVLRMKKERPKFQTKEIESLLPDIILKNWQLELANWISEYYFCSYYDAIKLMLPKHIWRVPKKDRKKKTEEKIWKKTKDHDLTKEQKAIVDDILQNKIPVSLIHGITGAGKTEVYKKIIQNKLKSKQQALLLVPEIALTPQLVKYFKGTFKRIAVIHSKISDGKKAELWRKIHSGEIKLIIGSRSAIFSPFKNLGVIVMDEEHEWTYKQDSSPRYNTKDVALKINELTGAQIILGSATPNVETMYQAQKGNFAYFHLPNRIHGTKLPNIEIADMCEELKGKNYSIFSNILEQKIESALKKNEQIILFLNRRGSASATVCRNCGSAIECKHCDVKLTYHAKRMQHQILICHHCGRISVLPKTCTNCNSTKIKHLGAGTEKVESDLKKLFPAARIFRADKDTMSKKDSFKKLHDSLENQEIDILIGTQMIAKGLDIPKVSLVGIVLADLGLHIPDFRASERSFQLLTQVAGRAGRRKTQGEVIIQAYSTNHPSIIHSKTHDYLNFYEQEISSRKSGDMPPFSKIIKLIYVGKTKEECIEKTKVLKEKLLNQDHEIYAAPSLIPRINNKYYWQILVQGSNPRSLIKKIASEDLDGWRIDVDPIHTV